MTHFDDLGPDEYERLMATLFTPNQRKIIESTPAHEWAALDQALARHAERQRADAEHLLMMSIFQPDEWEREMQSRLDADAEAAAALAAMTPQDWADLETELEETERRILRERGIEPD